MTILDTIENEVVSILRTEWNERNGAKVPETEDVVLKNGSVKIDATFLYADLAGSSILAKICPWQITAKVIRAYLDTAVRLIRYYGGQVRSFDGDRVMGIFINESPETRAVNCARNIDWVMNNIINPELEYRFDSISNNKIRVKHCVGIDLGVARAVRSGIRNNNDLIWIGNAPSFAAKLSDIRDYPYEVYISDLCYHMLPEYAKVEDGEKIWIVEYVEINGEEHRVHKTKHVLPP